jgi:muconate cycloisomerase
MATKGIKANIDAHLAPALIGLAADNINAAMLAWTSWPRATPSPSPARNALLDAQGKRLGLPVSELLGGRVRDSLEVAWTLASGDTARDIAEAQHMLEMRRHRIFKLKIGANPVEQDLKHVVAIKRELGDRASVRVDVNQYWDESQAIRACQVLGDNGIDLIEQPISRINRAGQVRLNQRSPAPIMADESIERRGRLQPGRRRRGQHLRPEDRQERWPARRAAHRADRRSGRYRPVRRHHARRWIGTLASAHAFLTLNKLTWDTELFGPLLLTEESSASRRCTAISSCTCRTPGLGLSLDEERLARFARR